MSNPTQRTPPAWLPKAQIMRAEGWPNRKISITVKACHHSVRLWLDRYPPGTETPSHVPTPKERPAWADDAERLKAEGLSWGAIQRTLGVSAHAIRLVVDPVFIARQRDKQRKARERTARIREDLAPIPMPERPKVAAGMLAAGRFIQPEKMRYGR